jgi:ferric-dicitrate binding protein FerR (iron transport regulator)
MSDPVESLLRLAGTRPAPPVERARRVRAAVHREWTRGVNARRRRTRNVALAAAAALALAIGLQWRGPVAGPAAQVARMERVTGLGSGLPAIGEAIHAGAVVATGGASRAALRLPTGASVRLDTNTRVTFRSPSVVRLSHGAIYVDTPPGASPLEVQTPKGIARELGTQFEVRVLESEVRVRVREGVVRLSQERRVEDARQGDELRTAGSDIARAAIPVHGMSWSWVLDIAPPFALEGRTLAEFLAWACRENGWTLEFADEAASRTAGQTVLHGSVEALTPAQSVAAVLPTSGFVARNDGQRLIVARGVR